MVVVVVVVQAAILAIIGVEARGPGVQNNPVLPGHIVSLRPTQAT